MSKFAVLSTALLLAATPVLAAPPLPLPADLDAAYAAAGMTQKNGQWTGCPEDDNGLASVADGDYRDINGDGKPDLVITDGGTYCYGDTGQGFILMTRDDSGQWTKLYNSPGIPTFLATTVKTPGNWPDVEIGGPGFCFPILRWNGTDYVQNRNHEEQKGACAQS